MPSTPSLPRPREGGQNAGEAEQPRKSLADLQHHEDESGDHGGPHHTGFIVEIFVLPHVTHTATEVRERQRVSNLSRRAIKDKEKQSCLFFA